MKNNKLLVIGLIVAAGIGFYFWNSKRIDSFNTERSIQLNKYVVNPPTIYDRSGWFQVVNLLIALGKNVYQEFQTESGLFYKNGNNFTRTDLDNLISDPHRNDPYTKV